MMASSRGRDRSSPRDGSGFGRIGCLLHQAEEHAIMNRVETEDSSYASARNRKLLAEWAAKTGENEYAEPALNPCQTTAYAFFTGDEIEHSSLRTQEGGLDQSQDSRDLAFLRRVFRFRSEGACFHTVCLNPFGCHSPPLAA